MNKSFTHLHFPETNDSPGNLIFQSSIFKCKHVSFREGSWPGSSQGCISQQPKESRPTCCGIWNRNGPRRPAKVAGDHQTHQWPILWQATKKHGNVIFPQPPPKTKKQTSFTKLWPNYFGCQIWYICYRPYDGILQSTQRPGYPHQSHPIWRGWTQRGRGRPQRGIPQGEAAWGGQMFL